MILNLQKEVDRQKAQGYFDKLMKAGNQIELRNIETRTSTQNRALHQFFVLISEQLNEMGLEFYYSGLKGMDICTRYTPTIVKEFFWRPIQKTLFDIESTKKLNTKQINEISDVIIKWFGEKGVVLEFPSQNQMLNTE